MQVLLLYFLSRVVLGTTADASTRLSNTKLTFSKRVLRRTACFYGAATVTLSPLVEPDQLGRVLNGLQLPKLVSQPVLATYCALHSHAFACLVSHELLTDASADVMAQAIAAGAVGDEMVVDWRRVPRSALSSFLSDDIPFLVWSRALWVGSERAVAALRVSQLSPRLIAILVNPGTITLAKVAITQIVYETTSNALYLVIQVSPTDDLHGSAHPCRQDQALSSHALQCTCR